MEMVQRPLTGRWLRDSLKDSNRVDAPFWTPPDPLLYVLPPPPVYVCRRPSLESIAHEISEAAAATGTEPAGEAGEGAGGRGPLGGDSGESEPVAGSGGVGVQHSEERPSGSRAAAKGRALGAKPGTGRSDDDVAGPSKSGRLDPLPATVFGPDDTGIVDKAGNIRLDTLNSRKIGQAFNAEQIQAARRLLLQSAIDVHERMQDA
jgi:hypothetical protein